MRKCTQVRLSSVLACMLGVRALFFHLPKQVPVSESDIAFMHIPYNAGHGTELVAMFSTVERDLLAPLYKGGVKGASSMEDVGGMMPLVNLMMKPGGAAWGHMNPDLAVISDVTGCPMYWTPQKYWPADLAAKYFGNKTVLGIVRDPYDRLVSFFRGNIQGYGGSYPEFLEACDVNGAVKLMLKNYTQGGNKFAQSCTFIPQAEYFEGPYGVQIPVDFQTYPSSFNRVMEAHGVDNMEVRMKDIPHVAMCQEVWGADLDAETRHLIQEVYKDDFELMCKKFGYCDVDASTCMLEVKGMCPLKAFEWDDQAMRYRRIAK